MENRNYKNLSDQNIRELISDFDLDIKVANAVIKKLKLELEFRQELKIKKFQKESYENIKLDDNEEITTEDDLIKVYS